MACPFYSFYIEFNQLKADALIFVLGSSIISFLLADVSYIKAVATKTDE